MVDGDDGGDCDGGNVRESSDGGAVDVVVGCGACGVLFAVDVPYAAVAVGGAGGRGMCGILVDGGGPVHSVDCLSCC